MIRSARAKKTHLIQHSLLYGRPACTVAAFVQPSPFVFCFFFNLTPRTALESLTNRSPYIYFFFV